MLLLITLNILSTNGLPTNTSAESLPIEIWRNQIFTNIERFPDAIQMCQINRAFYKLCKPFAEIKRFCHLHHYDIWPSKMLNIRRANFDRRCLDALQQHSHVYENAFYAFPEDDPLTAVEIIRSLNPKTSLTLFFPDYNRQMVWNSVNSDQLKLILDGVEERTDRSINIHMTYCVLLSQGF